MGVNRGGFIFCGFTGIGVATTRGRLSIGAIDIGGGAGRDCLSAGEG